MTIGQWVGQWFGEWFGSGEPAPAGSMSGTATVSLSTAVVHPLATTATDHAGQLFVFWHDGRLTVGQAVSPLHVLVEPPGLFSRHTQRGLASGELLRNVVSPDRSRRLDIRRPQHTTPIDAPAPRVVALDARRDVVLTPSIPPLIVVASAAGLVVAQRHNDLFILAEDSDSLSVRTDDAELILEVTL